jgi:hypothetical protein
MPINWYLQAELCLITTDWYGMTQNFVVMFLFEIQHPTLDQELQIIRWKVFEEEPNLHFTQEGDEFTAPLHQLQDIYNINVDEDDDPRDVKLLETEGKRDIEGSGIELPFFG